MTCPRRSINPEEVELVGGGEPDQVNRPRPRGSRARPGHALDDGRMSYPTRTLPPRHHDERVAEPLAGRRRSGWDESADVVRLKRGRFSISLVFMPDLSTRRRLTASDGSALRCPRRQPPPGRNRRGTSTGARLGSLAHGIGKGQRSSMRTGSCRWRAEHSHPRAREPLAVLVTQRGCGSAYVSRVRRLPSCPRRHR